MFARLLVGFLAISTSIQAFAQDEGEKPSRRTPSTAAVGKVAADQLNRARYRLYPGGVDEKDLKVQASLPIPTRYPDGTPSGGAVGPGPSND